MERAEKRAKAAPPRKSRGPGCCRRGGLGVGMDVSVAVFEGRDEEGELGSDIGTQ